MPISENIKSNLTGLQLSFTNFQNKICNKGNHLSDRILSKLKPQHSNKADRSSLSRRATDLKNTPAGATISEKTPWHPNPDEMNLTDRQRMIFDIMRCNVPSISSILVDKPLLLAVVWKKNPQLLNETKELVQKIFVDMESTISDPNISDSDSFHMEMIIGDLLSLYPFLRPCAGEMLKVPVKVDGRWQMIDYTVEKIQLTSRWMGSPIMAYGLSADNAPPLLLFKGTTFPTDKGFALSLLTDINPFGSVGAYIYHFGKNKIEKWLNKKCTFSHKAVVYGKSLGGALALHTTKIHHDKVGKVMAYGAPGLSITGNHRLNALKRNGLLPEINIFCQKNDPIPYLDLTNDAINYFEVVGSSPRSGVLAHADMYSTHENSSIHKLDFKKTSQKIKRIAFTIFRGILSFTIFPFAALLWAAYTLSERTVHTIRQRFKA